MPIPTSRINGRIREKTNENGELIVVKPYNPHEGLLKQIVGRRLEVMKKSQCPQELQNGDITVFYCPFDQTRYLVDLDENCRSYG